MRSPDWEMTQGDAFPLVELTALKGIDGSNQALAEADVAYFDYQRSGGRGERVRTDADIVSRVAPAHLKAPVLTDLAPGRYDSWFVVVFADGSKPLTWPNDGSYFGRVYPGYQAPVEETSP